MKIILTPEEKESKRQFYIDIVRSSYNSGIFNEWTKIRNGSYNQFSGTISFYVVGDDERTLHKINPKVIESIFDSIIYKFDEMEMDDDMEKNFLLAYKRNDVSLLDENEFLFIFQMIVFLNQS